MKTLLNVLFEENLNYSVVIFVLFLLVIECVYLYDKDKMKQISRNNILVIGAISTLFAGAVIVNSTAADDYYDAWAKPKQTGCILDMYKGHDHYYNALYLHYFEGKQLYICDDVDTKLEIAAHIMNYEKSLPVEVGGRSYTSSEIESKITEILDKTVALEKDKRLFILDKTWKNADRILCIQNSAQVCFLSEQLYLDAIENDCDKDFLSDEELKMGAMKYLEKQRGEGIFRQTIMLLSFFVLGYLALQVAFTGKNEWLSFFMSFPVGITMACAVGACFIILGIPFRKISILVAFAAMLLIEIYCVVKKKIDLSIKNLLIQGSLIVVLATLVSYLMIYSKQGDSFHKTAYGIFIAAFLPSKAEILGFRDYGLFEPIITAFTWKFKADFLYGLYLLMSICIIGMLVTSMVYLFKINTNKMSIIFLLVCLMVLLTNVDYLGISVWVLTNGPVACIYMTMLVSVVFALKNRMNPTVILATTSLSIMVARVEGTCYICLFFVLLCGLKEYREKYWMINLVVGIEAIVWQIFQFVFIEAKSRFWAPEKGVLLLAGGLVIIIIPFIMNIKGSLFDFVRRNYYKLCITLFTIAAFVLLFFGPELCYTTAKIFVRHFAASDCSNSAGIWGFLLLMLPLLLKYRSKLSRMLIAYVSTYLLMTYCIFAMRTGNPIHEMYYDSCRRALSQFMPVVIFTILYIANSIIREIGNDGVKTICE